MGRVEIGIPMENEKPWWVGQFESEENVRKVFAGWKVLLNSSDAWDEEKVIDLLAIISHYSDLDSYPFIFECLEHSFPPVRISAAFALTESLSKSIDEKGLRRLLQLAEEDSDPDVQGAALDGLGRVSRDLKLQRFIPLLLARLRDRNQDNVVRVSAYKGIIYAFKKEGEPNYHPFNIRLNQPADEQIDWDWIDELTKKYADNQ